MAFRYRILFYHENQNWVRKVTPLLDLPLFHVLSTDSDTVVQKQLESQEVDLILTGMNTQHFLLKPDEDNSLSYKQATLWKVIEERQVPCQVILLCTQRELGIATELVQSGQVADYFIVSPLLDHSRLFISIMKTLESDLMRSVLETTLLGGEKLPCHLLESIEMLQDIRDTQAAMMQPVATPEPLPAVEPEGESFPDFDTPMFPVEEPVAVAAEPDLWGTSSFSAFPEPDTESRGSALSADSVFASLSTSTDETSAFGAGSVFDSLGEDFPKTATHSNDTGFELPELHGPRKPGGGALSFSWSKMQKSEFEILLIDNDMENIGVVKETVEAMGYRVLVVHTAEEGLEYLNHERFDLLMVNRELPDQDGLDFLNKIRYKGPQQEVPAIVLSSSANEEHVIKSIKVGANYFIVKPLNPDRLLRHVFELVPRD
jgi:CheY-like chemotaxis protein